MRILGLVIVACGAALCHGAILLWNAAASFSVVDALRILGAVIFGVLGAANVGAGLVVLLRAPVRE